MLPGLPYHVHDPARPHPPVVTPAAQPGGYFSLDSVIDYEDSLMGGGFQVRNPNAVKSCACGQSFDAAQGGGQPKPCS